MTNNKNKIKELLKQYLETKDEVTLAELLELIVEELYNPFLI